MENFLQINDEWANVGAAIRIVFHADGTAALYYSPSCSVTVSGEAVHRLKDMFKPVWPPDQTSTAQWQPSGVFPERDKRRDGGV